MKTDNELIAEFMDECITGVVANTNERVRVYISPKTKGRVILTKYDTSWDWLMPVVEKINEEGYSVDIYGHKFTNLGMLNTINGCLIESWNGKGIAAYMGNKTKIGFTYAAVVEFIKWYNINK